MSGSSSLIDTAVERRRGSRRGAAVIEATLTLMLFLLLTFSLFDFGYMLYFHHTLMQQARAAARYGILLDAATEENRTRIRNYFLFNDPDNTAGYTTGILGLTSGNVDVDFAPKSAAEPVSRLVLTIRGYQYGLITFDYAGLHEGQTIVATFPMEYR